MARTTITDVRAIFENYTKAAERIGFDTTGWTLIEGSSTYGQAYRAYTGSGRPVPGTQWNGYLGTIRTETFEALTFMLNTLWAVNDLNRGNQA